MIVVEKLLFGEVEHKIKLFPFAVHWALLSCEPRGRGERGRGERNTRDLEGGWSFITYTHGQQVGTNFIMTHE